MGNLATDGPSIRPGKLPPSSLYDIAPTLLYLSGLPAAQDMQGLVIEAAIRPEILAKHPPSRIASYEVVGEPLARSKSTPSGAASEALDEMMANLRALGYVGGDPGTATAPTVPVAERRPPTRERRRSTTIAISPSPQSSREISESPSASCDWQRAAALP